MGDFNRRELKEVGSSIYEHVVNSSDNFPVKEWSSVVLGNHKPGCWEEARVGAPLPVPLWFGPLVFKTSFDKATVGKCLS